MDRKIQNYLSKLTQYCRNTLGNNFIGLYVHGSLTQNDFNPDKSDIDLLGIVDHSPSPLLKEKLAEELEHRRCPVPAVGMDLPLLTQNTVQNPTSEPEYEFWFSTGETWETELSTKGKTSEILVFCEICRTQGVTFTGPTAKNLIKSVPRPLLLQALIDILEWHRTKLLDPFHDPSGQYSILNACRAWQYAEENILVSKTSGGKWVLKHDPCNHLAAEALKIRNGDTFTILTKEEIEQFLSNVLSILKARIMREKG